MQRILNDDGVTALYAAMVRKAVDDVKEGYTRQDRPCARAFLVACGFMDAAGTLDARFGALKPRQGRKKAA